MGGRADSDGTSAPVDSTTLEREGSCVAGDASAEAGGMAGSRWGSALPDPDALGSRRSCGLGEACRNHGKHMKGDPNVYIVTDDRRKRL